MNEAIDYQKKLDANIVHLKKHLGDSNAKEDLRRFAHHLRNYEYSGNYNSIQSKLLIKAEIIKSIYELCNNSHNQDDIKLLLHKTFELNLKIHDQSISRVDSIAYLAKEISELNIDNKFSILIIQAKENYFSIIIEKSFEGVTAENLRFLSNLLIDFTRVTPTKHEIYKKLTASLKYIRNCPIKLHCLDKNINRNKFTRVIDLNQSANIRIFNFFSGNIAVGYSKLYETPKQITNFYSLNIVYAISYILAKKSLSINMNDKKIVSSNKEQSTNNIFKENVQHIIEYTVSRLVDYDKYVIGSLDRKFSLNHRVEHQPTEVKQVNINELDSTGLQNLKKLINKRINKVSKLNRYTKELNNNKFDHFVNTNDKFIPGLVLEQAKLIRAKSFFNKARKLDASGLETSAISYYTAAIQLDTKFKEAFFHRGINYYNSKNYLQAINDFSKAIEIDEKYCEAYHHRGLSLAVIKKLDKAIVDFSKATTIDKNYK